MSTTNPLAQDVSVGGGPEKAPTSAEGRASRQERAQAYRERYLLPRYVVEEDGSKRKLEAGEYDDKSMLYPLTTPIKDLSDFGIGISMYFITTFWLGLMMLVCGLLQAPTAAHFNSRTYDALNKYDAQGAQAFKSGGSASCLSERRVCLDADCSRYAGEFHLPSPAIPRFAGDYTATMTRAEKEHGSGPGDFAEGWVWRSQELKVYDDDAHGLASAPLVFGAKLGKADPEVVGNGDKLAVGKRGCELRRWFGVTDFTMMVFVGLGLLALGWVQNKEAEELDLQEQTAQDYSVMVEDPSPEKTDPDYWRDFFEQRFGKVFMVTVCLNNGPLLRLLKRKANVEHELKQEALEDADYLRLQNTVQRGSEALAELEEKKRAESGKPFLKRFLEKVGADATVDDYSYQLLKVNLEIDKLSECSYSACKVLVVFNEERAQRLCLDKMCVGLVPAALDWRGRVEDKYLEGGNLLRIHEAPEPSTILYENLDRGLVEHLGEQCLSWLVLGVGLVLTYYSVDACFALGQPVWGAILISLWNSALPELNRYLVTFMETPHTTDEMEDSFVTKTVAARWFTSSLILYLVGLGHNTQILGPYYVGTIQAVLLADAVTSPIVRLLDIGGQIKRHVLAPLASTYEKAKALHQGTDYLLAERYTDLAKTLLMAMFFSAIYPVGLLYSAFACLVCFLVDKYCILRLFRLKPPQGDKLVRITRTFVACVVLVHSVVTAHFYYSWPFDNLCPSGGALSPAGQARAAAMGAAAEETYRVCDQLASGLLPPVREEPWFQSDGYQYKLVYFYNVCSIITLCYICAAYFGVDSWLSVYSLFYYRHQPVGDAQDHKFDQISTAEGYVPQFSVEGMPHSVLACTAGAGSEHEKGGRPGGGGLEFDTYLLNWTASREVTETGPGTGAEAAELSEAERDQVYRRANRYFDAHLLHVFGLDKLAKGGVLSSARQYEFNVDTQEAGAHKMSLAQRLHQRLAAASHSPPSGKAATPASPSPGGGGGEGLLAVSPLTRVRGFAASASHRLSSWAAAESPPRKSQGPPPAAAPAAGSGLVRVAGTAASGAEAASGGLTRVQATPAVVRDPAHAVFERPATAADMETLAGQGGGSNV